MILAVCVGNQVGTIQVQTSVFIKERFRYI